MSEMVLALYNCRSKQEYIYRTNKIREITGGSKLLSDVYNELIKQSSANGVRFADNGEWKGRTFCFDSFEKSEDDAAVVYIGGGNMMIIFKSKDTMIKVNRIFTKDVLLEKTFTVNSVISHTAVTGDFKADRSALYAKNAENKNMGQISSTSSVLPFTQVDMRTYMPIVAKNRFKQESLSRESELKLEAYEELRNSEILAEKQKEAEMGGQIKSIYLDDLTTEKGTESLLAIIYIDGNNMGKKLKAELDSCANDYDSCIGKLRAFSAKTDQDFVEKPIKAIEQMLWNEQNKGIAYAKYRKVIAGGDEITLICNARMVPQILDVYFNTLDSENSRNYACAGVAIFHSHAPFADVYEIAEQCCESGKKQSRQYSSNANFIDFHYCRAAITNDMETVREKQENGLTARPYRVGAQHTGYSYDEFITIGKKLTSVGRANIKELANAMIKGDAYYQLEMHRVKSRYPKVFADESEQSLKKYIFDIAQVYDLWFASKEEQN